MKKIDWEVWEKDNGTLYLVVMDGDEPTCIFGGYEYNHSLLAEDIELLMDGKNPADWDENLVAVVSYNEIRRGNLIATDGKIYPEDMWPNGLQELIEGRKVSFYTDGCTYELKDISYIEEWNCEHNNAFFHDVKIGGLDAGDMYIEDLINLAHKL